MKYIKKYERVGGSNPTNEPNENNLKLNKCRELFEKVFDERLRLLQRNVVGIGGYNLYALISKKMDNNNFEDFQLLFNFLKEINEDWKLVGSGTKLRLDIYFEDIDKIINELEVLDSQNKYNL